MVRERLIIFRLADFKILADLSIGVWHGFVYVCWHGF